MTSGPRICQPEEILEFWFEQCSAENWFKPSLMLDQDIRHRFRDTHLALAGGVLGVWHSSAASRMAAIIVLDQFPWNIYRGTALAFATDGLALREAKAVLDIGADQDVPESRRLFFYLPFEHAEDIAEQQRSVGLFESLGNEQYLDYAHRHHDVIAKYGRFPHRNNMLGRTSTRAEFDYLAQPDSGF